MGWAQPEEFHRPISLVGGSVGHAGRELERWGGAGHQNRESDKKRT